MSGKHYHLLHSSSLSEIYRHLFEFIVAYPIEIIVIFPWDLSSYWLPIYLRNASIINLAYICCHYLSIFVVVIYLYLWPNWLSTYLVRRCYYFSAYLKLHFVILNYHSEHWFIYVDWVHISILICSAEYLNAIGIILGCILTAIYL